MKRTLYHGTTAEAMQSIKERGFYSQNQVWVCSDETKIYFYDLNKVKECNNCDTTEEAERMAITKAFENAQIAAARNNSQSNELVVIKITIDDDIIEVLDDDSCENMIEAVCISEDDLEGVNMELYTCSDGYSPALRLFVLKSIWNMTYFDNYGILTTKEQKVLQILDNCYFEELLEFEWE